MKYTSAIAVLISQASAEAQDFELTESLGLKKAAWWNSKRKVHCKANPVTHHVSCTDDDDNDFHV